MNPALAIFLAIAGQCPDLPHDDLPRIDACAVVEVLSPPHSFWGRESYRQWAVVIASSLDEVVQGERIEIQSQSHGNNWWHEPITVFEKRGWNFQSPATGKCRLPPDARGRRFVVALQYHIAAKVGRLVDWWPAESLNISGMELVAPEHGMGRFGDDEFQRGDLIAVVELIDREARVSRTGVDRFLSVVVCHVINGRTERGARLTIDDSHHADLPWRDPQFRRLAWTSRITSSMGTAIPGTRFVVAQGFRGIWKSAPVSNDYDPWEDFTFGQISARLEDPTTVFRARRVATPRNGEASHEGSSG